MSLPLRKPLLAGILLALAARPVKTSAPVPRESPELKFQTPSDQEMLLSNFRGKVVLLEFLLTNCPHCLRVSRMIDRLHGDLGPRGFEPIGIAFENNLTGPLVAAFALDFKVAYPIAYTSSDRVDAYLGRSTTERFQVPQIVVIDRRGVIRAQSRAAGETTLEDEDHLRSLISRLLKERGPGETSSSLWTFTTPAGALLIGLGGIAVWIRKNRRSPVKIQSRVKTAAAAPR